MFILYAKEENYSIEKVGNRRIENIEEVI